MEVYSNFIEFNQKPKLNTFYCDKNAFTEKELKKIDKIVSKLELNDGIVGTNKVDKSYRSSKISWIPLNDKNKWLYDKIGQIVNKANSEYWNFSIIGMSEQIQYGEYQESEQGHYDWHLDLGGDLCRRKISVTIQLSNPDEYEGGELQFMTSKKITDAPKGKGCTILFPSYLLHRVTPVTKGTRRSLVVWISGEPFR